MRVERRDLEHLDQRQLHLGGERGQVARVEAVIFVLQQVQEFDQQIAAPRLAAEQRLHVGQGRDFNLTPARRIATAAATFARMNATLRLFGHVRHGGHPIASCSARIKSPETALVHHEMACLRARPSQNRNGGPVF